MDAVEWYREDGETLAGSATGEQLQLTMSASEAGSYACRATLNGVGSVTSAFATLQLAGTWKYLGSAARELVLADGFCATLSERD